MVFLGYQTLAKFIFLLKQHPVKPIYLFVTRDNVVWDEEQEQEARSKIEEQMKYPASAEDQGTALFHFELLYDIFKKK